MPNFADRLIAACREKNSIVCVGIDPRPALLPIPGPWERPADAFVEFSKGVMDAVADVAVAVKPQSAFFEVLGADASRAYWEVAAEATKRGLLVIADVKRSDIGSTAAAYAQAYLGGDPALWKSSVDAVTVNPYLGSDGLVPFVKLAKEHDGGVFVLVKTSNPSSGELQDLVAKGRPVYEHVAQWVADHADDLMGESGYSSLGAVVGATYPEQLAALRRIMPKNIILIPGYGAQGGGAKDVAPGLNADGLGAIVNASRSIIFAYRDKTWAAAHNESEWTEAVAEAARKMRDDLNRIRP